jgi:hypothetical protein
MSKEDIQNEIKNLTIFKSPFKTLYYFFLQILTYIQNFKDFIKKYILVTIFSISILLIVFLSRFYEGSHQKVNNIIFLKSIIEII